MQRNPRKFGFKDWPSQKKQEWEELGSVEDELRCKIIDFFLSDPDLPDVTLPKPNFDTTWACNVTSCQDSTNEKMLPWEELNIVGIYPYCAPVYKGKSNGQYYARKLEGFTTLPQSGGETMLSKREIKEGIWFIQYYWQCPDCGAFSYYEMPLFEKMGRGGKGGVMCEGKAT